VPPGRYRGAAHPKVLVLFSDKFLIFHIGKRYLVSDASHVIASEKSLGIQLK